MNLKFSICSWIFFFIILNSDTHGVELEETYSGPLIEWWQPLHPITLCFKADWKTAVGNGGTVDWENKHDKCSSNIRCKKFTNIEEVTLPQRPENGVICGSGTKTHPRTMACFNGKCLNVTSSLAGM